MNTNMACLVWGNIFWNLTPRMQMGAEIDLGVRRNFSGAHRWAHRFGIMAQFSF